MSVFLRSCSLLTPVSTNLSNPAVAKGGSQSRLILYSVVFDVSAAPELASVAAEAAAVKLSSSFFRFLIAALTSESVALTLV